VKYQAIHHTKMIRLGRLVGSRLLAVGIVESVIALTVTQTPRGDIGALTDAEIEEWVGWEGEPGAMIRALVEARWLDECTVHRLILHDWAHHAPKFVIQRRDRAEEKRGMEPFFHVPVKPVKMPDIPVRSPTVPDGPQREPTVANGPVSCTVLSCSVLSSPVLTQSESSEPAKTLTLTPQQQALDAKLKAMFPKKEGK